MSALLPRGKFGLEVLLAFHICTSYVWTGTGIKGPGFKELHQSSQWSFGLELVMKQYLLLPTKQTALETFLNLAKAALHTCYHCIDENGDMLATTLSSGGLLVPCSTIRLNALLYLPPTVFIYTLTTCPAVVFRFFIRNPSVYLFYLFI